jgi:hypothetical protein
MKRVIFGIVVLLIVGAYLAGYLPQNTRLRDAESKLAQVSSQLDTAQQSVRLFRLQDQAFLLVQETANQNYGNAMTLSTKFFDGVRDEISRAKQPALKSSLESILAQRDAVTTALAKGDSAANGMLQKTVATLQQIVEQASGDGSSAKTDKPSAAAKPNG